MATPLSTAELRCVVDRLPRVPLAHLPTPLEPLPRFSRALGGPEVYIKRDDCTGLLFGGNKTRHSELIFGHARELAADCFAWGAGVQSNNCRQTAAACARLGLECHLVLTRAGHGTEVQGNLLLDYLMGAHVDIVDVPIGPTLDEAIAGKARALAAQGRRVYSWDRQVVKPRAAVSYLLCMCEIVEQMAALGRQPAAIYICSAGSTGSGMILAKEVLGLSWGLRNIAPIRWPWNLREDLAQTANAAAELLRLPHRVRPDQIDATEDFLGAGYGIASPEGNAALKLLARTEGILLDPVYTAKAMAALMADVRAGRWRNDGPIVFVHTGGTPAVFAYRDELLGAPECA
jgi:1-aminocyclopropane-1-carboxylate deaminase/D-cysteine desulfhydrase-like pyridoxal-dependent ACC family enzyme